MNRLANIRRRVAIVSGSLVIVGIGFAVFGSKHSAAQAAHANLNGSYEIRADARSADEAANLASISAATRLMDPEIARHWRGMLSIMVMPQKRVQIANTAQEISIATGGRAPLKSAASGTPREAGDAQTLQQEFVGNTLVKRITSATFLGKALNTPLQHVASYELSSDGQTLVVQTHVEGGLLPQAVEFRATYGRVPF